MSARTLIENWQPLHDHLEASLGKDVELTTAPSYLIFQQRTLAGEYPFIITNGHLGRMAQRVAGYRPLFIPVERLYGLLVVAANSQLRQVEDLGGASIATPDPLAVITLMGAKTLRDKGLLPGRDVQLKPQPTNNAAVLTVLSGENDAAIISRFSLNIMSPEIKRSLRVIANTQSLPASVFFMAGPQVSPEDVQSFRRAVQDFASQSEAGREFMARFGYGGLRQPPEEEMRELDPYAEEVERLMENSK